MFSIYQYSQIKIPNNIIEQDQSPHQTHYQTRAWLCTFAAAKATIAGIELHHMLKKGQMTCTKDMPVWQQFYALAADNCAHSKDWLWISANFCEFVFVLFYS